MDILFATLIFSRAEIIFGNETCVCRLYRVETFSAEEDQNKMLLLIFNL